MKIELDVEKMSEMISEFIAYKKECELFGRGYNITGFCQLYILSENNKKANNDIKCPSCNSKEIESYIKYDCQVCSTQF